MAAIARTFLIDKYLQQEARDEKSRTDIMGNVLPFREWELTEEQLRALPEYSCSLPTFTEMNGKLYGVRLWKRDLNAYAKMNTMNGRKFESWVIGTAEQSKKDGLIDITWYRAVIIEPKEEKPCRKTKSSHKSRR